jgi:hypothetical protein
MTLLSEYLGRLMVMKTTGQLSAALVQAHKEASAEASLCASDELFSSTRKKVKGN